MKNLNCHECQKLIAKIEKGSVRKDAAIFCDICYQLALNPPKERTYDIPYFLKGLRK